MYKTTFVVSIALAAVVAAALIVLNFSEGVPASSEENTDGPPVTACTMEAKQCPDGSFVGRTGPDCSFAACPEVATLPDDIQAAIDAKADLITVKRPVPGAQVEDPITVSGSARGYWFFEGSFPVIVTNWDGLIIGEGFATAQGEWMTESFVPFIGTISYTLPTSTASASGTLIFKKDNPSGLPQHDDALEIPIVLGD